MKHTESLSKFQTLNRTRIERLSALLPIKAHAFLELLPLLFQTNNPVLPGYISQEIPVGIVDYQPTNAALDAAKSINHTFQYRRHSLHRYPIHGLYLINENGLLNYDSKTAFELWLIYVEPITLENSERLQQKVTAICEWAASFLNIKLNARLFNEASLSSDISAFDLDRFYLSGLLLAGLPPSSWHSSFENREATSLDKNNTLDFGILASTVDSAQLLLDRTLAQIDRAMDSDLKACLSLIFDRYQLQNYPDFSWLSDELKRVMNTGTSDPLLLDKRSLQLNYISQFNDDPQALFIAQQSFYILSHERLSKQVSHATYPWRRAQIEQLHRSWHWPNETTTLLDKRGLSHYRQSLSEYQELRKQIAATMHSAFLFAQQHKLTIDIAKQALKKKFNIIFNTELDAINCLPLAFKPQNPEQHLYLARTTLTSNWKINDLPENLSKEPLYQHASLLNVLAWAVTNQLVNKATRLQMIDQAKQVKMSLVLDLIQQLLHSPLSQESAEIKTSTITKSAEIDTVLLFANLEHQAISSLSQQGLELSSLQADPLNYANSKQSLVASVEGLIHSSWGHWHYVIYTGPTSLLALLSTLIQWQAKKESALTTSCWCPSDSHGKKISDRIETVYREILSHYVNHPLAGDYFIAIADHYYRLQWQQGLVDILPLAKNKTLEHYLAESRAVFSASKLDPSLDKDGLLGLILSHQKANHISLLVLSKNNTITLYLVDDLGTLFKQHMTGLTVVTLCNHYYQFFSKITPTIKLDFFHLTYSSLSGWTSTKITVHESSANKSSYLPVSIELDSFKENAHCVIHCGPKKFIGHLNDPSLFKQVSDLVLNLRHSDTRYPLYINQLSFTEKQNYTFRHYITLKQQIESLLNQA